MLRRLCVVAGMCLMAARADTMLTARIGQFDRSRRELLTTESTTAATRLAIERLLGAGGLSPTSAEAPRGYRSLARIDHARTQMGLRFPDDMGFHADMAMEWVYFVGTLFRSADRHAVPPERGVSVMLMFMYRQAVADSPRCLEVQFSLSVPGSPPVLSSHTLYPVLHSNEIRFEDKDTLMSLQPLDAQWNGFRVRANALEHAVTLSLVVTRTHPVLLHHGTGFIGNPMAGNGYAYYSLVQLNARGEVRVRDAHWDIRSGRLWLDHQWGTIGVSTRWPDRFALWLLHTVGIQSSPVDAGFGIVGIENWWCVQFNNGEVITGWYATSRNAHWHNVPLKGASLMTLGGARYSISGHFSITEMVTLGRSEYPLAVEFVFDAGESLPTSPRFTIRGVEPDSRMKWASGGYVWEGATDVYDTGTTEVIGVGFMEAVGWDRTLLADVLLHAGVVSTDSTLRLFNSR
jgi:hypothetical protein